MGNNKKILIIDDEKDLRELLAGLLRRKGYQVFLAKDGEEGFEIAKEVMPDLIISDVLMPKMDGSQLLKRIRESYFGKKILFIVLTAREKMRDYFEVVGVDDFIEKPVSEKVLLSKVESVFKRSESGTKVEIRRRILVVGRYEECVENIAEQLEKEGCHIDFVISGEQVVSKAVMFLPSIIIMESRMFDMGSNAIIRILRQMPQFKKIPILIYSFFHKTELKGEDVEQKELGTTFLINTCMDEGATEYIGRYDENTFIQKVNKYIKKGTIVVIDDDEGIVLLLKKKLEAEGYQVSAAREANAGLELVKRIGPSLIVLDIIMPEIDGYELLGLLKGDLSAKDIPVIMLTVKGADNDIQKGLDLGADDYFVKPVNMALLTKRINAILKKS